MRAVSTPRNGFTRRQASSLATCPAFHAWFSAAFRTVKIRLGGGAALAHAIRALVGFTVVPLAARLGPDQSRLRCNAAVPVLNFLGRQLADQGGAEGRQNVGLGGAARIVDRFAAPGLEIRQIIRDGLGDRERAGRRVVAFLSAQLGAPPFPRGFLGLPIVEHSYAVSVLQIVAGADFVLGITPGCRPPPRKPCAALAAAAVAEREGPLQPAPVGLRSDGEPQPSGASFEVRVADGAGHFATP
jgi:hypothetical protein